MEKLWKPCLTFYARSVVVASACVYQCSRINVVGILLLLERLVNRWNAYEGLNRYKIIVFFSHAAAHCGILSADTVNGRPKRESNGRLLYVHLWISVLAVKCYDFIVCKFTCELTADVDGCACELNIK